MDACVFCGLISADSARWIAKEDAAVAFLPLPGEEIAPGHTLVVPRRHTTALADRALAPPPRCGSAGASQHVKRAVEL